MYDKTRCPHGRRQTKCREQQLGGSLRRPDCRRRFVSQTLEPLASEVPDLGEVLERIEGELDPPTAWPASWLPFLPGVLDGGQRAAAR